MLSVQVQSKGYFDLDVDLVFPDTICALFGVSGAGKSTLLRAIAGLESCTGTIIFQDETWLDSNRRTEIPVHRRPIGYVRQNVQLFPHLSVEANLLFPLRFSKRTGNQVSFEDVVSTFELKNLLARKPSELSGGETQRVAIGRALLSNPKLLLLDEPLTGLDIERKAEILPFIQSLHEQYEIPTIYVSHAIDEVTVLCSFTAVISDGRIQAAGDTEQVLERTDLEDAVGGIEASAIVQAEVIEHDLELRLTTLKVEQRVWNIPLYPNIAIGSKMRLRVRARDVSIAVHKPQSISIRNVLEGTITEIHENLDSYSTDCLVTSGSSRIRARITLASLRELNLNVGDRVFALVKSVTLD